SASVSSGEGFAGRETTTLAALAGLAHSRDDTTTEHNQRPTAFLREPAEARAPPPRSCRWGTGAGTLRRAAAPSPAPQARSSESSFARELRQRTCLAERAPGTRRTNRSPPRSRPDAALPRGRAGTLLRPRSETGDERRGAQSAPDRCDADNAQHRPAPKGRRGKPSRASLPPRRVRPRKGSGPNARSPARRANGAFPR